jgi:hypothetical protein
VGMGLMVQGELSRLVRRALLGETLRAEPGHVCPASRAVVICQAANLRASLICRQPSDWPPSKDATELSWIPRLC